jgi:hypothetical protein
MNNFQSEDTISFPKLVFKQIQIIQDICKKELREGDKIIKNLIGEQFIEGEDSRHSYLQSVDLLGSLLSPWFDVSVNLKEDYDLFVELYQMELITALKDEDFQKEIAIYFGVNEDNLIDTIKKDTSMQNQINIYFLNYKVKEARVIFRKLLQCFKDNDFLIEGSYGEGQGTSDDSLDADDSEDGETNLE